VIEQFRYRISLHITGYFYPFAVRRGCPWGFELGSRWVPPEGILRRLHYNPISPQVSRLRSSRFVRSAAVHASHACSRAFALGKAPGLRTDEAYREYNSVCLKLLRTASQFLNEAILFLERNPKIVQSITGFKWIIDVLKRSNR
jgi:hypothetical protein